MINTLAVFREISGSKSVGERKMDNNSTYEQYEQEIDLKDLMFAVLHKWRPVILVAVVLAVLLGGAKGAMTYRQQNDPEVSKETREKYQEELDLYEKNKETAEREIENLKTDIANQQEYLDKSIWINMSPYDVCESRIDMYVTTGYEIMPGMVYQNQDYTDTILQAYQGLLLLLQAVVEIGQPLCLCPLGIRQRKVHHGADAAVDCVHRMLADAGHYLSMKLVHVIQHLVHYLLGIALGLMLDIDGQKVV